MDSQVPALGKDYRLLRYDLAATATPRRPRAITPWSSWCATWPAS